MKLFNLIKFLLRKLSPLGGLFKLFIAKAKFKKYNLSFNYLYHQVFSFEIKLKNIQIYVKQIIQKKTLKRIIT